MLMGAGSGVSTRRLLLVMAARGRGLYGTARRRRTVPEAVAVAYDGSHCYHCECATPADQHFSVSTLADDLHGAQVAGSVLG